MFIPIHCIALHTVKHNDKSNILSVFTLEQGRMALLLPAGTSKEAVRRRALTMPLSIFECVADVRPGREISTIRDVRPSTVVGSVHSHPVKISVAIFIAELLGIVLREVQADRPLYIYIEDAIRQLDLADDSKVANFPIAFLYRLGRFLGIEPDISTYAPRRVFDLIDGLFRDTPPLHRRYIGPDESAAIAMLSRMTWDNLGLFKYNRQQRRRILTAILEYYSLHYATLSSLRSIDVLQSLFD